MNPIKTASQIAAGTATSDTVGKLWRAWNGGIYFCDSHDPACGYWMTGVLDPSDRRNISETAIHRTYHRLDPL